MSVDLPAQGLADSARARVVQWQFSDSPDSETTLVNTGSSWRTLCERTAECLGERRQSDSDAASESDSMPLPSVNRRDAESATVTPVDSMLAT